MLETENASPFEIKMILSLLAFTFAIVTTVLIALGWAI